MSGQPAGRASGRFTGRHLLLILVAGFGIVIAVNLFMAVMAMRTFPGLIVENSYVASQEFNKGLQAGRQQQQLGWQVATMLDERILVVDARNARNEPLHGATMEASFHHPLGAVEPVQWRLLEGPDGRWRTPHALPAGRWELELTIRRDGQDYWMQDQLTVE